MAVFDTSDFILLIVSNLYNSSYWSFVSVKKSQKQTNRPTGLYVPLNDFLFYFKWRENVENENFFGSSFHSHPLTYGVSNHLDNENLNNCIGTSIQIEGSIFILWLNHTFGLFTKEVSLLLMSSKNTLTLSEQMFAGIT